MGKSKEAKPNASPGLLAPNPAGKSSRKTLGLIAAVIIILLAVLMSGLTSGSKEDQGDIGTAPATVETENKPLTPPMEGFGLVAPDQPEKKEEAEKKPEIITVGPPAVDPEREARRREADEIRRRRFDREQQAYGAALLVKREGVYASGGGSVDKDGDGYIDPVPPYGPAGPDAYDPAADRDKEQFFVRSDAREWQSPYTREAGKRFELKTGTVVPGVMVSGVNSDLPGSLIAQVSQNVYDTASGRHLLIPQGAKLYGVYDSRVVYGQSRVLIAWNRVIFPDGSAVTLGAMPGTDMAGYAGFKDKIDNHYLRIFGSAVMMSLVSGGMSYAVDQVSNNSSDSNSTTIQDEMTAALASQLGQTTLQLLQKNLNIKPTLEIRPGYQFNVIITKDVVFRETYGAR